MQALDYEKLGFKCGLEIHQRLATREKLFCSCSAQLGEDLPVAEVERKQKAVAGELGKIDPSATFEASRNRRFVYNAFRRTTCLVETDEEPPHELNREALGIALLIAASFNASVISEFEPMRKAVVDGSDPSAFQRTLMIGDDGHLEVGRRKIKISSIFLEEESGGVEYGDSSMVIYNLDRLGIPLIEIDTDPEIRTPEEAKEVARKIGLVLRLTGKVQRGLGSIRQDVNVSIASGARVEIKGFQDLETMDKVIESEIRRQLALLEIGKELRRRRAGVHKPVDVTHAFSNTNVRILKKSLEVGGVVLASRLSGFEGLLGREIGTNRRFGSEISDYAKLAGVGGIIHSDEDLKAYGFEEHEIAELHSKLDMHRGDAMMLVTGPANVCKDAIEFANMRAERAAYEIPNETRGVDSKNLGTIFLRPLPGGARMYPETDVRPISLNVAEYEKIKEERVDSEKVIAELEDAIKNRQLAEQMLWSPYLSLFWEVVKKSKADGSVVAPILLEKTRQAKRMGVEVERIGSEALVYMFKRYRMRELTKAAMEEIIRQAPRSGDDVAKIIREKKLARISGHELRKMVQELAKGEKKDQVLREIMSRHRLNVDGEELAKLLN